MLPDTFDEEIQLRLLKILGSAETKLTQRELAEHMCISVGKTNYCITELAKKGFIKINHFRTSKNKLSYAYILTPRGIEERFRLMIHFLSRKLKEYDALKKEISELRTELSKGSATMPEEEEIPEYSGRINPINSKNQTNKTAELPAE